MEIARAILQIVGGGEMKCVCSETIDMLPFECEELEEGLVEKELRLKISVGKTFVGEVRLGGGTLGGHHDMISSVDEWFGGAFLTIKPATRELEVWGDSERLGPLTEAGREIAHRLLERVRAERFPSYTLNFHPTRSKP